MTHRAAFVLLIALCLAVRLLCDWVRLASLRKFDRAVHPDAPAPRVWWNSFEEKRVTASIPASPLRARIRSLQLVANLAVVPIVVLAFFDLVTR